MRNVIYRNRGIGSCVFFENELFLKRTVNGIENLRGRVLYSNDFLLNWYYKITDLSEEEAKLINAL